MGGGVCTGGEGAVECGLAAKHARRVRLGVARRIPGAGRVGVGGGEEEEWAAATSICTLYRRREVRLYTDGGSGGRGG